MPNRPTAEQKCHWDRVAALGCVVTQQPATIHHCHGGSMKERGVHRAIGRKTSHWLVIPLAPELHFGAMGIDSPGGVAKWERLYGKQADYLDQLVKLLGVDVWALARAGEKGMLPR